MIDLHVQAEYDYNLLDVDIKKVSDYRIEGRSHQISPRPYVWSNDADQEYVVNFVIEFDAPIKKVGGCRQRILGVRAVPRALCEPLCRPAFRPVLSCPGSLCVRRRFYFRITGL